VPTRRDFLAAVAAWPQKSQRKQRPPDLEVIKISTERQEGRISYDGVVKVTGERPLVGLVLHFEFFESRGVLLSQQKIQIEDATLAPGDERSFQVQGRDVPRAVSFKISASETNGRDLNVARVGPYPLD